MAASLTSLMASESSDMTFRRRHGCTSPAKQFVRQRCFKRRSVALRPRAWRNFSLNLFN